MEDEFPVPKGRFVQLLCYFFWGEYYLASTEFARNVPLKASFSNS